MQTYPLTRREGVLEGVIKGVIGGGKGVVNLCSRIFCPVEEMRDKGSTGEGNRLAGSSGGDGDDVVGGGDDVVVVGDGDDDGDGDEEEVGGDVEEDDDGGGGCVSFTPSITRCRLLPLPLPLPLLSLLSLMDEGGDDINGTLICVRVGREFSNFVGISLSS